MKRITIEIKWAILFSIMTLVWSFLEKQVGLHDKYIDYQTYLTNLYAIPATLMMLFALLDKKKNFYKGQMSFKQGVTSGIILSVFIAFLAPFVQWVISFVISPDFFKNAIQNSLNHGYYRTFNEAKAQYNFANYVRQGTFGALALGVVTSAILMIFLQTKTTKNLRTEENF
ncbi:DUF4199 domain-containing protein [Soonwooa sp.]|uniref:DUF4199 domain-containing protein n=1 Tax=Soonwooa sp. TaxID=1938592 RepID=UPI002602E42D|nr:DUF4199 domain-containing protein [Soonwooa sp.]